MTSPSPFSDLSQPTSEPLAGTPVASTISAVPVKKGPSQVLPPIIRLAGAQRYVPSGKTGSSVPLFLVAFIPVAALVGWCYFRFFGDGGTLLVSEICTGLALSVLLWPVIYFGKCRSPKIAAAFGALTGFAALVALMLSNAFYNRPGFVAAYADYVGQTYHYPRPFALKIADASLTPAVYLKLFFKVSAAQGNTLSSDDARSPSTPITGNMYWLLCAVRASLIAATCGLVMSGLATRRFHEDSNQWYRSRTLYSLQMDRLPELCEQAQAGNWATVGALARERGRGRKNASIKVESVPWVPGGIVSFLVQPQKAVIRVLEANLAEDQLQQLKQA